MTGFTQGFAYPNRNASGWDSDLNANFALIERGYVVPVIVGTTAVNTGAFLAVGSMGVNSYGVAQLYSPNLQGVGDNPPEGMALQAGSPGNVIYALREGSVVNFPAYSGQLTAGAYFGISVFTPGWATNCLDHTGMFYGGKSIGPGHMLVEIGNLAMRPVTRVVSGFAHAASGALGVWSIHLPYVGAHGLNTLTRIISQSCDNFRLTIYANSNRSTTVYDTQVLSGNIGVRTIDMIDAAMWPYSSNNEIAASGFGSLHARLEVLSSAVTAINSQAFQFQFTALRQR